MNNYLQLTDTQKQTVLTQCKNRMGLRRKRLFWKKRFCFTKSSQLSMKRYQPIVDRGTYMTSIGWWTKTSRLPPFMMTAFGTIFSIIGKDSRPSMVWTILATSAIVSVWFHQNHILTIGEKITSICVIRWFTAKNRLLRNWSTVWGNWNDDLGSESWVFFQNHPF